MRGQGKSWLNKILIETLLTAGKRVLEVTPQGSFLKKRKKHLTLIEKIK